MVQKASVCIVDPFAYPKGSGISYGVRKRYRIGSYRRAWDMDMWGDPLIPNKQRGKTCEVTTPRKPCLGDHSSTRLFETGVSGRWKLWKLVDLSRIGLERS